MGQPEWSSERRETSSDGIVQTVRLHLRRLLAETPTPFPCRYACFIHPRRRQGERGFGVITPSGESLPLTVTLLESLRMMPTLLDGRATVVVGPGTEPDEVIPGDDDGWDVPLPVTQISIRLAAHEGEVGAQERRGKEPEAQVLTPAVEGPQLTLLCAERPPGWPP